VVDMLQEKKINGPDWCSLCQQDDETIENLIMACPFTKYVWK
jgi:hypothetical protein